jgi:hypothetical protein
MIKFVLRDPTTRTSSLAPMSRNQPYQTRARAGLTVAGRAGTIRTVMLHSTQAMLKPERDRQVFGYWFGPREEIPSAPTGRPTGAVLPEIGKDLHAPELICLDLVPVDNYWLVLSEVGRYTYRHTTELLYGEQFCFVPVREAVDAWPVVFHVEYADPIAPDLIAARYGNDAWANARPDALAVQLRLIRQG